MACARAVASFGGSLIWGWLNANVGVSRCAPLMYLLPPVTGVISWIALGESFSSIKIAGALMAVAGVAAAQFGPAMMNRANAVVAPLPSDTPADDPRRQSP